MAILIPRELSGHKCSLETAHFFRVLKKLDNDFTVRFALDDSDTKRPQFFVLYQDRFAFLIQVAATSQQLAESAIQADFLANQTQLTPDTLGAEEAGILNAFSSSIAEGFGPLASGGLPVRKLVVFPDVRHDTIDEIVLQRSQATDIRFLGLQQRSPADFARHLRSLAESAIPEPALVHLRAAFDPDSVIPRSFSPLAVRERDNSASLTKLLLDLDQEWCVKNDLVLPPEQERLANDTGYKTQLVTGVAGCGKSLVLLYRALLGARLNPDQRILVLTHNRPLRSELERRFHILSDHRLCIEWRTFFQWASHCLGNWPGDDTLAPRECQRIIEDLLPQHPKLASSNPEYLLDEISWIKDLGIRTRTDYLQTDRTGRGKSINREAVWHLFKDYQKELQSRNVIDWPGVAIRFHDAATAGRLGFPHYDFIFVDEAQFFAKSWFTVVRAALKPGGHLFLAADPTQGFLRRRQSWLASGIDVRGRTTRLKQPYRNSRAILLFAATFYQARASLDPDSHRDDELNIPTAEQIATIEHPGTFPEIISGQSPSDQIARTCHELQALRKEGLPDGQVLILHTDRISAWSLHNQLVDSLGDPSLVHNARGGPLPPTAFCQHATLNAATGLEAPVVFLLGIDAFFESEHDPRLSADQRAERLRDHTRQLYMAFTRAGQRLVIICQREDTLTFLQSLTALAPSG
jgi:superfamily I DNA/RNA helicase